MTIDSKLPAQVEDWRRKYEDVTIFRAMVQTIPVVGGAIDTLIARGASHIVRERLDQFFGDLREGMAKLIEADVDRQYIESLDYAHLVLLAMHHSSRSRQREKIRMFARLLTNAVTPEWAGKPDQAEELLDTLAELSMNEVAVLRAVCDLHKERKEEQKAGSYPFEKSKAQDVKPLEAKLTTMSPSEIRAYLARLQRTGLVVLNIGEIAWDNLGDNFTATDLLDRLMAILHEPGM